LGALVELQQQGKIHHIGVSNVDERLLGIARGMANVVSVQNRYNFGDRESEHAVAKELQPLIRLDALVDPRRVSERAAPQLLGKPLDERCERGHARR